MENNLISETPNIVLISPSVIADKFSIRKAQPPLGIAYIAAVLEENGYEGHVFCIDAVVDDYDNVRPVADDLNFIAYGAPDSQIVERLHGLKPDLVGISALFSSLGECAFSLAKAIKESFPQVPIVMGGNHASYTYTNILSEQNAIDYVLTGESDYTFLEFVNRYFGSEGDVETIGGLARRDGERIRINPRLPFNNSLDDLPDPAWHLLPMERYFEIGMPSNPFVESGRVGTIMTSRGCPEHCYFCTSPTNTGNRFRAMTPGRVLQQIKNLVDQYSIKEIQIQDDNFTVDHKRVIKICEGLKGMGLRLTTPNAIRADMPLNRTKRFRMYKAMQEAGFAQISVAPEHGDQDYLNDVILKRLDLEEVRASCDLAHDAGLLVHANFIMGFPGETQELRQKTIDYAKTIDADSFSVSLAAPLPGTPMWRIVEKDGLFMPGFKVNRLGYTNVNIKPVDIEPDELKTLVDHVNRELNNLAQQKRPETKQKYVRFQKEGKTVHGDRKFAVPAPPT